MVYANEKRLADAQAKVAAGAYLPTMNVSSTLDDIQMSSEHS